MSTLPRLYDDLAWLWCELSPPADYVAEVDALLALMNVDPDAPPPRILDLGCGAGRTLVHLAEALPDAVLVGLDLAEAMLVHGRRLIPSAELVCGDMRDFDLSTDDGRGFDFILLHDAADYLTSMADRDAALACCARHLAPGGRLVVAPTHLRETFAPAAAMDADDPDRPRLFSVTHDPDPADSTFELILLCLVPDNDERGPLRLIEDRHRCGLFIESDWIQSLEAAGLSVQIHDADDEAAWDAAFVASAPG